MPAKLASSLSQRFSPVDDDWSRDRRSPDFPIINGSDSNIASADFTTGLFPPPSALHSSRNRPKKLLLRLKSDPCLREHSKGGLSGSYTTFDFTHAPISPISIDSRPGLQRSSTPNSTNSDYFKLNTKAASCEDEFSDAFPPFNLFGQDVFRAVITNSAVIPRLCAFAEARGGARDLDFLQKVREYSDATKTLASTLSAISASFVGVAASSPIKLPNEDWKDLNTDMKQVSSSIVPYLDGVFRSTERYVEQRLIENLYPSFLVSQISHALLHQRAAMGSTITARDQSFCLTNPYSADHDIVCVSDGFLDLTGYSPSEILHQNCRFLQGPNTRYAAITRVRSALLKGEATSELVLNYCKDGHGFWNLLFIAPLVDSDGVLQYHLGGQIDISQMISNKEDLIKLLTSTSMKNDVAPPSRATSSQTSCLTQPDVDRKRLSTRRSASPQTLRKKSSRTKFLQSFRKAPLNESMLSPESTATTMSRSEPDLLAPGASGGSWSTIKGPGALPGMEESHSPYSQYMVIQLVSQNSGSLPTRKNATCRFPVAFCSNAMLKQLGLGRHELLHREVFDVFQEVASPWSGSKSLKALTHDQLIEGKSVKLDIAVRRSTSASSGKHRKPGMTSLSNWSIFTGTDASHIHEAGSCRDDHDSAKLTSYWTPLKDGAGSPKWVVVILMPAASET